MKRILSLTLALLMLMSALSGCAAKPAEGGNKELSTEERTTLYKDAIEENRSEDENTNFPLMVTGDEVPDMLFEMLGITKDDLDAFAMYVSMMNVQAYAIAAVHPAADKADTVMKGFQDFIERQKQSFDMYLVDQFEIASNAKLEKLEDGTILLVMCENQDKVFTGIKTAIADNKK